MAFGDGFKEVIQEGAIREKQDVPVTYGGEEVGRATVFPDGQIIAHLSEDTYRGKMLAGVLKRNQVSDISINPNFTTKGHNNA